MTRASLARDRPVPVSKKNRPGMTRASLARDFPVQVSIKKPAGNDAVFGYTITAVLDSGKHEIYASKTKETA